MGIGSKNNTVDDLHPLAMIDIPAAPLIKAEYPNGLIKGASGKLPARGRIVQISNGPDMVPMDDLGRVHFPHVEGVAVAVLAAHREVYRLDRVKCQAGALVVQVHFLDR